MFDSSGIARAVRRLFDERSGPREPVGSEAATLEWRGRKHQVRLVDRSLSGAMVISPSMPHIGEQVALHLHDLGRVSGQVRWVRDGQIGVNFAAARE